jgi:putative hydrolase of the HAD superfamily
MPESRYGAVIFDLGGVLTTSPVENFAAFEKARGLPSKFIGGVIKSDLHGGPFARFERGEVSHAEFCAAFARATAAAGFEIGGAEFIALLDVAPRPEMLRVLRTVKASGLKTGCITNNFPATPEAADAGAPVRHPALAEALGWFDAIIESARAGVRKPEPVIYEMMCATLRVDPRDCVFLDDLGVNLKPARAMGMHTIKVPLSDPKPAIAELSAALGFKVG